MLDLVFRVCYFVLDKYCFAQFIFLIIVLVFSYSGYFLGVEFRNVKELYCDYVHMKWVINTQQKIVFSKNRFNYC